MTPTTTTMQAITRQAYGGPEVLDHGPAPIPEPGPDEVLIRVHASSVNPADWHTLTGLPLLVHLQEGLRHPKRGEVGVDVAGVIEAVGTSVTQFSPGDRVWGGARGAFAEYAISRERSLVHQPDGVPFEQTAAIPIAGLTALQGLRDKGELRPGDRVLVIGASGGVGTYAVQIAKAYGAEVTAVVSGRNVDMVRALGADDVVDYQREDFASADRRYDVILDNVGERSFRDLLGSMPRSGRYVMVSGPKGRILGPIPRMVRMLLIALVTRRKLRAFLSTFEKGDLEELNALVADGRLRTVIDRRYDLASAAEAMRHQGEGHARGKTVILVRDDESGA